jgi:hypothetical protein
MSRLILVLGKSGTGKSTSLRNFKKDEINVISITGKELPFRTDIKAYHPKSYAETLAGIEQAKTPVVVIDDANYLMSFYEFATINEVGYSKFSRNADNMVKLFNAIINKETDQNFYVLAHSAETEDGRLEFKTTGKMVSEKYNISGITNIIIESIMDDASGEFVFRVQADGRGVKTPLEMFNSVTVPNDLKAVNKTINDYYKETTK